MVEKSNWLRIALLPAREAGLLQAVVHDHDPGPEAVLTRGQSLVQEVSKKMAPNHHMLKTKTIPETSLALTRVLLRRADPEVIRPLMEIINLATEKFS